MTLILTEVTPPTAEPVTRAEAKSHCRIDGTDDDDYVDLLIKVARRHIETTTNRALVAQTWDWVLDNFPNNTFSSSYYTDNLRSMWVGGLDSWDYIDAYSKGILLLPKNPLISVTSIKYVDTSSVEQTWSSASYTVDTGPRVGRIYPVYNGEWPVDVRQYPKAVTIRFVCGYEDSAASPVDVADNVPAELKQAILLIVCNLYERGCSTDKDIPEVISALITEYRNWKF